MKQTIVNELKLLLTRLSIVLLLMTITRLIFFIINKDNYQNIALTDFIIGLWFDTITISMYFAPYILLQLLPVKPSVLKYKEFFLKFLFFVILLLVLALNLMDVEYFKFTGKRSTFDVFTMVSTGNTLSQLAWTFIKDFWMLIFILIALLVLGNWLYSKTQKRAQGAKEIVKPVLFNILIIVPIFVVIARGGLQLKPIGMMEVSQFTSPENSSLVLNTPFTMLKSYGKERLEMKNYFSLEEEKKWFNPIQNSKAQNILPDKTNLVIIILESFGNEFIGAFNNSTSYSPFLDSLIKESLTFEYGIANGKKSIEAVPSIIASIPSLMDNPYISSPYGNNKINSLAHILKKSGYSTAFYHGATNGSMRFDSFAAQAGFEKYIGRTEYGNDRHSDKTWGILDEYFNPWVAKEMSKLKTPFFGTLFTLSSHHPYFIPKHMRKSVKIGSQPIAASINYADISLRYFFNSAKKQAWFNNTLFVFVADHTPASTNPIYNQRSLLYQIPIAFYHPKGLIQPKRDQTIFQQMDIMPTVLDLLNIETKFYAYGSSYYKPGTRSAISYLEGSYFYFQDQHMLTFSNEKARNLYDLSVRNKLAKDVFSVKKEATLNAENRIKAIIQRYNRDLVHNKTIAE